MVQGTKYYVRYVRTEYKDSQGRITNVDETRSHKLNESDNYTDGWPSTYNSPDRQYNAHLSGLQTTGDVTTGSSGTTFRWYKNNELIWNRSTGPELVSCTVWDEVTIRNLGLQVDMFAGPEQAICADLDN